MPKLHELIAVEPDLKAGTQRKIAELAALFSSGAGKFVAQLRRYSPLEENGEKMPDETTELATTVQDELASLRSAFSRWMDVSVQKEQTNGDTTADVVVGDQVILRLMSSPALLNLEAKLAMLKDVYERIPTNDLTERWDWDEQQGVFLSAPKETYRTQKVPKALVGAPATDKQPANVQYYQEDIRVGVWTTTKRSGMLSPTQKRTYLERIDELLRAVKAARQRANDMQADDVRVADILFGFIHRE